MFGAEREKGNLKRIFLGSPTLVLLGSNTTDVFQALSATFFIRQNFHLSSSIRRRKNSLHCIRRDQICKVLRFLQKRTRDRRRWGKIQRISNTSERNEKLIKRETLKCLTIPHSRWREAERNETNWKRAKKKKKSSFVLKRDGTRKKAKKKTTD